MTVVLFHDNCEDGFTAAYVAWTVLGDSATYIPVQYGQPIPQIPEMGDVFILDFSYSREIMYELGSRNIGIVVIIDHHKTAAATLSESIPGVRVHFDMEESGASLTWKYFYGDTKMPVIVQYTKDRDLWKFQLPDSREISTLMKTEEKTFENWRRLEEQMEDVEGKIMLAEFGAVILRAQNKQIDFLSTKTQDVIIHGYVVKAVNSTFYASEIGEKILKMYPEIRFAAVWFDLSLHERVWSLRSRGDFDVSAVAKSYGGGGHQGAAGFRTLTKDDFRFDMKGKVRC
jgi:oligoribonuclease NrnB/cAMP/cGMP phosphodiesterase (DHH superfamily)